jgi:hypothetical protein
MTAHKVIIRELHDECRVLWRAARGHAGRPSDAQ